MADLTRGPVRAAVQVAVDDEASTDPGRPRDVDHVLRAAAGAAVELAEAGHVGIVGDEGLRAGGAAQHVRERDVVPARQVWRVDEDAAHDVDRARRRDRDSRQLVAAAVALDLARRPLDHALRRAEERRLGLEAAREPAVGARQRDAYLGPAEIDACEHSER